MSQYNFGNLSSPLSGTALIDTHLEPWRDALHSCHKGNSRPSYAVAGMIWVNDTTTPWVVNLFDGTDDISIGTVNATTNVFKPNLTVAQGLFFDGDTLKGIATGCSLIQQSAQSIPNNTFTALTFGSGSEVWDDNNYHDVTTNNSRITPAFIGRGVFNGQVTLSTTGAIAKSLKLYKNGAATNAEFRNATNTDAGGHVLQIMYEDSFNATDYYELFCAHTAGVSVNTLASGTFFQFRRTL